MSILKLAPACKDYLWGGTKLITDYGKRYDGARLAETWELSGHPDGPSVLASGPDAGKTLAEYLAAHPGALGEHGRKFAELPVLIKLIDAAKDLSDAFLYCGFSRDISRDELARRIADNTLPEVLCRVNVKAGDTVFIPAGTIHAICRGIVVAEVQQSSNVTYRVCDYGRLGPDGKPRALHIAQALDVTRRTAGVPTPDFGGHLARCDYFTVDLLAAPQAATCGGRGPLRRRGRQSEEGREPLSPRRQRRSAAHGHAPRPRHTHLSAGNKESGRSAPRFSRFPYGCCCCWELV